MVPVPPSSPSVGLLETCLEVDDLPRSLDFYTRFFGFPVMVNEGHFCALDVAGRSVLLIFCRGRQHGGQMSCGRIPPHGGSGTSHIGFSTSEADLPAWEARLAEWNIPVESKFTWPTGGTSVFFRDPDGHLLEFLTPHVWPTY